MNCLRTGKIAYRDTKEDCELFIEKPTHFPTHRINDLKEIQYSTVDAWAWDEAVRCTTPVPYVHPRGLGARNAQNVQNVRNNELLPSSRGLGAQNA